MTELSHLDERGAARMVDVSGKPPQKRTAVAAGRIALQPETLRLVREGLIKKGDVLAVARVAGVSAAKRTAELIPLCHNIPLGVVTVDFEILDDGIAIRSTVVCTGPTGVEMEALTAVAAAALTIYDMCKAVDKSMRIGPIRLVEKRKESPEAR